MGGRAMGASWHGQGVPGGKASSGPPGTMSHGPATPHVAELPAVCCRKGHGSHVAGIIGAAGNNSLGIAGINWKVGGATAWVSRASTGRRVVAGVAGQVSPGGWVAGAAGSRREDAGSEREVAGSGREDAGSGLSPPHTPPPSLPGSRCPTRPNTGCWRLPPPQATIAACKVFNQTSTDDWAIKLCIDDCRQVGDAPCRWLGGLGFGGVCLWLGLPC